MAVVGTAVVDRAMVAVEAAEMGTVMIRSVAATVDLVVVDT